MSKILKNKQAKTVNISWKYAYHQHQNFIKFTAVKRLFLIRRSKNNLKVQNREENDTITQYTETSQLSYTSPSIKTKQEIVSSNCISFASHELNADLKNNMTPF